MDGRRALAPGPCLVFHTKTGREEYTVRREIGRGGSCIVYEAAVPDSLDNPNPVRVRECYPHALKIARLEDGSLRADPKDEARFRERKERMLETYSRHRGLFCTEGLENAVTAAWNYHEAYGTVYVVSAGLKGETLAERACGSVHECVSLVLSTAGVLRKIHGTGCLYLDLKPENVLTFPGVTDLVQLFDFDSLIRVSDLEKASREGDFGPLRVSYSRGFAPPEQAAGNFRKLGAYSDVFSLGAVLFHALWGRTPTAFDCGQDARYDYGEMRFPAERYGDRLFRALTDFFRHTLAAYPGDRYPRMEEAEARLREIAALADESVPRILAAPVPAPAFFTGREKDLEALHALLHTPGHRLFSLSGLGGIGKSTLVRAYLAGHREEYDAVIPLYDGGSVPEMIAGDSAFRISTVERMKEETTEEYAGRKLRRLREILPGLRVLAVVDNTAPERLDDLRALEDTGWDMLLVSREALPEGVCPSMRLGGLGEGELEALFVRYSHTPLETEGDREDFRTLAGAVSGHTLTVELLARQVAKSHLTLREAAVLVKRGGLRDLPADRIDYVRDNRAQSLPLTGILDRLTELEHFTAEEKQVLKVLSAFDRGGIEQDLLFRLMKGPGPEAVREAESGGWLSVNRKRVVLHPLMLEYIRTWPWDENCRKGADAAMRNLCRMILPKGAGAEADRQFTADYGKLFRLLEAADRLVAAAGYESAPKQKLRYRVLMDAPVDRDGNSLRGMLELLENPAFLSREGILRLYEQTAYLYGRLGRFPEAYAQLEKMKGYLAESRSTYFRSRYHLALAKTLHNEDMYGRAEEILRQETAAIFTARVSRHPEAKTHLAACLVAKAVTLMCLDREDDAVRELLREAEGLVNRYSGEFAEERYSLYCTAAMYAARHGGEEAAEEALARASRIADLARDSDLAYVDHLLEQPAWIFRAMGRYDRAAEAVLEAIGLCAAHADARRYYEVMISAWSLLDEIYGEAGDPERAGAAADEVNRLIREAPWPISLDDPIHTQ